MSRGFIDCLRLHKTCNTNDVFEWKITWKTSNFYKLCVGRIGKTIVSPIFKLKNHEALLYVFPESLKANINSNRRRIVFSIYLHILKRDSLPLKGTLSFELTKPSLPLGELLIQEDSYVMNYGWGFQRCLYRQDFKKHGWAGSIISCKISLQANSFLKRPLWSVEKNNLSKLADDLESLLESGELSDVKIKVGDRELNAHKNILSARSPVFAAMLSTSMLESNNNEISIVDVEFDVVQHLLQFIYTGKLKNPHDQLPIEDLTVAADKYDVAGLKDRCGEIIIDILDLHNVVKYLFLAHHYSVMHLFKSAVNMIRSNWELISESDEWKELKKTNADLAFFMQSLKEEDDN